MTNEEAIKVLKDLRIFDDDCEEDCEAIDLGISALKKQIKLNEIGFTEEVIENYKIFEDECITKGFTFKSLLDARDKQINGGWIPCSERLPENLNDKNIDCFLVTDGFLIWMAYYNSEIGWQFAECTNSRNKIDWTEIIAWRPLPTPYQESEVL